MLVVEPHELRAWRIRLAASQTDVAKLAKSTQSRVSDVETRLAGQVRTYVAINRALRELEANQRQDAHAA